MVIEDPVRRLIAIIHLANRTATAQNIDLLLNVAGSTIFVQYRMS